MKRGAGTRGVTLVELIVAIAIIGTGVAGILAVMEATTRRSADPMILQQAQLIGESYLEEILQKKFYDPDSELRRCRPGERQQCGRYRARATRRGRGEP
jgi:prepilin-type N-terminal cleavage/methylation domain-containing protein